MIKKRTKHIIKTVAFVMASVLSISVFETDAAVIGDHTAVPTDPWLVEYGDSLELQNFTVYSNVGDVQGEYVYSASGELYHSLETLQYEDEDGYLVKKIWNVRPSMADANVYLYTYRYQDDKTLCYMDNYENGVFDHGTGWVWNAEGETLLYVRYDSNMEMEEVECTYYDEEGRQAYILSGLSDLESIDWNATDVYSYQYDENGVTTGYIREGQNNPKIPCYRQEVIDEQVLLEMEYTERTVDSLVWYAYDQDGRILYEISVGPAWNKAYSEIDLEHYLYSSNGECVAKYSYDVVDDILIQNTESNVDSGRSFEATFGDAGYPEEIVSDCSLTDRVVIQYHNDNGALKNLIMGDE